MEDLQLAPSCPEDGERPGADPASVCSTDPDQKVSGAARPNSAALEARALRVIITGHTHQPGIITARNGTRWVNTGSWKARVRPAGRRRFAIDQPLDVLAIRESPAGELDIALHSARDTNILDKHAK